MKTEVLIRRWVGVVLGVSAVLMVLAPSALGEDVAAPYWRGDSNSTWQAWDFLSVKYNSGTQGTYYGADGGSSNPYGTPELTAFAPAATDYQKPLGPGPGGAWTLLDDNSMGYRSALDVLLPNRLFSPPESYKLVRVQVTYDINEDIPLVEPDTSMDYAIIPQGTQIIDLADPNWAVLVADFRLEPNPDLEVIHVVPPLETGARSIVSEVVVDTICIPEPASVLLLVCGAVVIVRRR